ncbi:ABC transporter permease [Paracoccaceae bacterium GXU_MW_L88]
MSSVLPRWADVILIPLLSVIIAFTVAGLVVLIIGESPWEAVKIMIQGSLGSDYGIGYTLYFATNFIFTGLCVAIAFHASLFNIGGEGQAAIGGLGVALIGLTLDQTSWLITLPLTIIASGAAGAAWAAIPAYLQAKRGSHIVITTIMFNFIAAALMVYLLNDVIKAPGSQSPETRRFAEGAQLPRMDEMAAWFGISISRSPLNISFFVALLASLFTWLFIWRTKTGYALRAFGQSEPAALYAGINPIRITMIAMLLSGAMAGMMALNTVMGDQQRLLADHVQGAGFVGIAVALMGRSHPVGVILAAILFGILYQGGAELSFMMPSIPSQMILVIQALVILFAGALENMVRFPLERLFIMFGLNKRVE